MQRFDTGPVGTRVQGRVAMLGRRVAGTRSTARAFGAGVVAGVAVAALLGFGPFRALAARAGGRARHVVGRATNGQAFVDLSPEAEPVLADTARDVSGRSM